MASEKEGVMTEGLLLLDPDHDYNRLRFIKSNRTASNHTSSQYQNKVQDKINKRSLLTQGLLKDLYSDPTDRTSSTEIFSNSFLQSLSTEAKSLIRNNKGAQYSNGFQNQARTFDISNNTFTESASALHLSDRSIILNINQDQSISNPVLIDDYSLQFTQQASLSGTFYNTYQSKLSHRQQLIKHQLEEKEAVKTSTAKHPKNQPIINIKPAFNQQKLPIVGFSKEDPQKDLSTMNEQIMFSFQASLDKNEFSQIKISSKLQQEQNEEKKNAHKFSDLRMPERIDNQSLELFSGPLDTDAIGFHSSPLRDQILTERVQRENDEKSTPTRKNWHNEGIQHRKNKSSSKIKSIESHFNKPPSTQKEISDQISFFSQASRLKVSDDNFEKQFTAIKISDIRFTHRKGSLKTKGVEEKSSSLLPMLNGSTEILPKAQTYAVSPEKVIKTGKKDIKSTSFYNAASTKSNELEMRQFDLVHAKNRAFNVFSNMVDYSKQNLDLVMKQTMNIDSIKLQVAEEVAKFSQFPYPGFEDYKGQLDKRIAQEKLKLSQQQMLAFERLEKNYSEPQRPIAQQVDKTVANMKSKRIIALENHLRKWLYGFYHIKLLLQIQNSKDIELKKIRPSYEFPNKAEALKEKSPEVSSKVNHSKQNIEVGGDLLNDSDEGGSVGNGIWSLQGLSKQSRNNPPTLRDERLKELHYQGLKTTLEENMLMQDRFEIFNSSKIDYSSALTKSPSIYQREEMELVLNKTIGSEIQKNSGPSIKMKQIPWASPYQLQKHISNRDRFNRQLCKDYNSQQNGKPQYQQVSQTAISEYGQMMNQISKSHSQQPKRAAHHKVIEENDSLTTFQAQKFMRESSKMILKVNKAYTNEQRSKTYIRKNKKKNAFKDQSMQLTARGIQEGGATTQSTQRMQSQFKAIEGDSSTRELYLPLQKDNFDLPTGTHDIDYVQFGAMDLVRTDTRDSKVIFNNIQE